MRVRYALLAEPAFFESDFLAELSFLGEPFDSDLEEPSDFSELAFFFDSSDASGWPFRA